MGRRSRDAKKEDESGNKKTFESGEEEKKMGSEYDV